MMDRILPSYKMRLAKEVKQALENNYIGRELTYYIENWHEVYDDYGNSNFGISYSDQNREFVDLDDTLHRMDGETLLKIAIDLGVKTPDFIPSIPVFKNEIKSSYTFASKTFEKAFKDVDSSPDIACGLAVAALESIIKEIMADQRITINCRDKRDIVKLTEDILSAFNLKPDSQMIGVLRDLGSGIIKCANALGEIRGDKSSLHGHKSGDIIISESTSAYFVLNCVCSIGLFLIHLYQKNFPKDTSNNEWDENSIPF